jgi:hypothetical protein
MEKKPKSSGKRRESWKKYYYRNKEKKRRAWREWYKKNKKKRKEYDKQYYENNKEKIAKRKSKPEYREKNKLRSKTYRKENPNKAKASNMKWRKNNPEKYKEYVKQWRKKNIDKVRKRNSKPNYIYQNIRARAKKNNISYCSKNEFIEWYNLQPKSCVYCGITKKKILTLKNHNSGNKPRRRFDIDRKDNSFGYTVKNPSNMVLSCSRCNSIKSDIFSYEEMKKIAKKYVMPKWKKER